MTRKSSGSKGELWEQCLEWIRILQRRLGADMHVFVCRLMLINLKSPRSVLGNITNRSLTKEFASYASPVVG